jgi:predicted nucleic acid-binding protein
MIPNAVVVDSNLILSALIPKASQIRDILLEKNMSFYAPDYLITEVYKHKTRIISFSKLSESEFYLYFNGVIERITFIPIDFIGTESR